MYRLVIPDLSSTQYDSNLVELSPEQCHYLKRVVRLKDHVDRFVILNGKGQSYIATLQDHYAKIIEKLPETPNNYTLDLTLLIALPKGDHFETILKCCTELGVNTIIPLISDRTLLKPSDNKLKRWRTIIQESTEQCERSLMPILTDCFTFKEGLNWVKNTVETLYLCEPRLPAENLFYHLQNNPCHHLAVLTGPEGGWTDQEILIAQEKGAKIVSLGDKILRAVTAPIVVTSWVSLIINKPSA